MNTRLLFFISVCVLGLAVFFYRSQGELEFNIPKLATSIEYEATQIDALQTNPQGQVEYLLTADSVIHYSQSNQDVLSGLLIDWQPSTQRSVQLKAKHGTLDNNTGDIELTQDVVFNSSYLSNNQPKIGALSRVPMQLVTQKLKGNFNNQTIYSDDPILATQGNHKFAAAGFHADLKLANYEFNQIVATFEPPERQNLPLF